MNKIKRLEITRLIKEFDFLESDLNLKMETINDIDDQFHSDLNSFLVENPKLKHLMDEKQNFEIENNQHNSQTEVIKEEDFENPHHDRDPRIKHLYRQLSKTTHPDVSKNKLNEIFITAKQAYEDNNLFSLISICEKLNIPYELSEEEIFNLQEQIDTLKKRLKFLESTYTWQWFKRPEKKEEIFLSFIKSQLTK